MLPIDDDDDDDDTLEAVLSEFISVITNLRKQCFLYLRRKKIISY